jgi:hypothetical protein
MNKATKIIITLVIAVLIMWACVYVYIFNFRKSTQNENISIAKSETNLVENKNNAGGEEIQKAKDINDQVQDLVKKVSKYMKLPTDDTPQLFEITDPKQLSDKQVFFKDSLKGDKLLVYAKSAQAIIYRPSTDKIINVGPISFANQNTK